MSRLPQVDGHAPRVALLVYNDAHADSRVLKTATSLRSAGAQVRIFAVARERAGYGEGDAIVGDGIEVHRSPEFSLQRYAPWALDIARRVTGREAPPAGGVGGTTSAGGTVGTTSPGDTAGTHPPGSQPVSSVKPTRSADDATSSIQQSLVHSARSALNDVWLRTYRTVSLSLYWATMAREVIAWRPDVVHANDGNTLAPAWWIAQRTGANVVYDAHELWRHRNVRQDRPIAPIIEAAIEAFVIGSANGVITVSPSIATWLQHTYELGQRPTLVRNIPYASGVDPAAQGLVAQLRDRAGLDSSDQVIAYGGRITTSRGIEETLAALTLLPQHVHFVLLGYGEAGYLGELQRLAGDLGVTDRVHFVGAVAPHEVSAALGDADVSVVFVRPVCLSYEFSLPNKLFESIHAGLPIVAANLPDTAAIVREYGVGEIFDLTEPADLAQTISKVLEDPAAYRKAAQVASGKLDWEHEELALIGLYADVLG